MTHLEEIQKMSAFELADLFEQIMDNCFNYGRCGECDEECPMYECCNDSPYDNIEDWLNSEVDE